VEEGQKDPMPTSKPDQSDKHLYHDFFARPELHEHRESRAKMLGAAFLIVLSLGAGFVGGWAGAGGHGVNTDDTSRSTQQKIISSESDLISSIAKDVSPSVVSVNVTGQTSGDSSNFFFSGPQTMQGAGTGIIIASNGLIVTNRHVVPAGTTDVDITLSDGTELDDVSVLGRTKDSDPLDVAFLKINNTKGKKLVAAKIGDSSKVQVGDKVVAIGNALGQFQNTVTSGIISGYGRSVQAQSEDGSGSEDLQDMFQTDTAINAGNSGGPLVNMNSEVIGINTAIAGDGAQGIGFAIPTADVSGLIKTVISTGKFQQPYLGVRYVPLTNDAAEQLKLSVTRGAYILTPEQAGGQETILSDSPASKAGLKPGDVILEVNGKKIDERNGLTMLLNQKGVNDTVTLKVLRDGKEISVKVKLEPSPVSL
jgi:serine protease Do